MSMDAGLVGHWKFNEKSGIIANDSSRYRNTGTLTGATHLPVWSDKGIKFDGVDDYVELSQNYVFTSNNTLSFWAAIKQQNYLGVVGGNLGAYAFIRFGTAAGQENLNILIETNTNGDYHTLIFNSPLSYNVYYHFIIVQDGSKVWRLWINGILQSTTVTTTDNNLTIRKIGEGRQNVDYFNGSIDEVRIYNRALSAAEIKRHYEATKHNYI